MAISFGGLATGLDTTALIQSLMEIERQPIVRLETDKVYFNNRLSAYTELNTKLNAVLDSIKSLDTASDLQPHRTSLSSEDYFSATASSSATAGVYDIRAMTMARVQKDVAIGGYSSRTDNIFHGGTITLDLDSDNLTTITLDADDSLEGIKEKINAESSTSGITASIINDGTENGYRLILTGQDSSTNFAAVVSGVTVDSPNAALDFGHTQLSGYRESGTYADSTATNFRNGTITINGTDITLPSVWSSLEQIRDEINVETPTTNVTATVTGDATNGYQLELSSASSFTYSVSGQETQNGYAELAFSSANTHTQAASSASIIVDGITITGDTNTFSEAIEGVTLTMSDADNGATTTNLSVSQDEAAVSNKIQSFVTVYNDLMSFISTQSKSADGSAGILNGDVSINMIKRRLQGFLTTRVSGTETLQALSQLGLETQKDGTIKVDTEELGTAIKDNLDDVIKILAGHGSGATEVDGVAEQLKDYLDDMTSSTDGILTSRKQSNDMRMKRIDTDIERIEMRLVKREETLMRQFNALEELVNLMNSQSDYLTQQMEGISNLWRKKK